MSTLSGQLPHVPSQFTPSVIDEDQAFAAVRFAFPARGRRVDILGLGITDTTLEDAAHWIIQRAQDNASTTIGFVNAHFVNLVHEQPNLRDLAGQFDCLYADGIGVKIAARLSGIALKDNVNGTDLFPILCRKAAAADVSLFLLGGRSGVAAAAARNMLRATSGLKIGGAASGHFADRDDEDATIAFINASGADVLLVGMGMPVQEQWIERNRHRLAPKVIIAVGGLFDFFSGRIQRAPKFLRKNGLEWAWRLAMEPRRLFNRYVIGNVKFLVRLATHHALKPVHNHSPSTPR